MSLPVIRLSGTPFEQGRQHGLALKDRIAHNLAVYFERFEGEGKLPRPEVLVRAGQYLEVIGAQNAAYREDLRGLAAGSGFSLEELAALNVRYEILYHQYTANAMAMPDDCSSFAVLPQASANGHLLMGQNWDWVPEVLGAIVHTTEPDGLETVSFTEAGIVGGKIGLNSAGLGLAINGMITTDDDWARLRKPFHVRCYEILRSREFEQAVQVVTGEERSCSTNFLIAQVPDRVVDLEASPDRVHVLTCEDDCLVHTNHFLDPDTLGVVEPPSDRRPYSYLRHRRLGELLQAARPLNVDAIRSCLADHDQYPNSLCRHPDPELPPEQRSITVTSAIMDLEARLLLLTDRQPCQAEYQAVSLETRKED